MSPEQAITILDNAVANMTLPRADHLTCMQAVDVLRRRIATTHLQAAPREGKVGKAAETQAEHDATNEKTGATTSGG